MKKNLLLNLALLLCATSVPVCAAEEIDQKRVEEIFNAGSQERRDLSYLNDPHTDFDTVLQSLWINVTNNTYQFVDVKEGRSPRSMANLLFFNAPTIRGNVLSFPIQTIKGLYGRHSGRLEIIETTENGAYTYEAQLVDTQDATRKIPINVRDGIIQVKLGGDLDGDNQFYSKVKTDDRINYFDPIPVIKSAEKA